MDDLRAGTRFQLCGKGKGLDSKAYLEVHLHNVVKLFEKLEECHPKVHFEKSIVGMFHMGECGFPPLPKWMRSAIGPSLKPENQMKGFLGVLNWYSIYISKFSNIAAPSMTSLQGKYQHVPRVDGGKGRCKIPRERNYIQSTPELESAFVSVEGSTQYRV